MRHDESRMQIACVRWFKLQWRRYSTLLNSVPNGGARDVVTGRILKAEGVVPGVADLELNMARGHWHGLKIELKTPKGRQSATQKAWQTTIEAQGYKYIIVRSLEEFIFEIDKYLKS